MSFYPKLFPNLDYYETSGVIPPGGYLPRDGSLPMTGDLDMGGNDIINVATITGSSTLDIQAQDLTLTSINDLRIVNGISGRRADLNTDNLTANRIFTFPNSSGTFALISDLTGFVSGTGVSGQVAYWNGTSTQTGSNNFFWDITNFRLGIRTNIPSSPLHIVSNDSALLGSNVLVDVYDATINTGVFSGRKARGTSSSPTKALINDALVGINGKGFATDLGTFTTVPSATITLFAAEDYTVSTSVGSYFELGLTPIGSSTRSGVFRITGGSSTVSSLFGFGTTAAAAPLAKFDITGDIAQAAWTTSAIGLRWRLATYTDTTSSGTVASTNIHSLSGGTLAASSVTTYTIAYGLNITPPTAGTNVIITNPYALGLSGALNFNGGSTLNKINTNGATTLTLQTNTVDRLIISATGLVGVGNIAPVALLTLNGNSNTVSSTSWTTTGIGLRLGGNTYTDTTGAGTIPLVYCNVFAQPTFASSSAITITDAFNVRINNPVLAGTNTIITNTWALGIVGNTQITGDISFIGTTTTIGTTDSNIFNIRSNNSTRISFATNGTQTHTQSVSSSGNTAFIGYTQSDHTGGAKAGFLWTAGTLTGQTASTEVTDINFALIATKTWATGAITTQRDFRIQGRTYAFVGSSTITDGVTLEINSPILGTNALATRLWNTRHVGTANVGIGGKLYIGDSTVTTAPTALLTLAAGTATANTAPLKLTSGTNLTTPENGAVEFDGTNYYVTTGGVRYILAKTLTTTAVLDFPNTAAGTSSDLTVALIGAVVGEIVDIGVPNGSTTGNGTFWAWVSAADTITVRFMNNSLLASLNPASGTFRVAITKYI